VQVLNQDPWVELDTTDVEIRCLNAVDLDVEELESRLEMAVSVPNDDCWVNVCPINV
jgi:hypothetical protein